MIIVMQGRVRSTRLPAKGFFTFFGQTVWERMCDIALAVEGVEEVVLATGDDPANELIRPLAEAKGVRFLRGPEDDVLGRYLQAIENYDGEYVIRLTCDNYLVQPEALEAVMAAARADDADYAYVAPLSHYAGEVVRCDALRRCRDEGASDMAREHVTYDIREGADSKVKALPRDLLGLNHPKSVTLDTVDDFISMKQLEANHPELEPVRCAVALKKVEELFNT